MKKILGILLLLASPIFFYNSYTTSNIRLGQTIIKDGENMFYRVFYPFSNKDIPMDAMEQMMYKGNTQKSQYYENFSESEKTNAQTKIIVFAVIGLLFIILGIYLIIHFTNEKELSLERINKSKVYSVIESPINVYSKIDESSDIVIILNIGDKFQIDTTTDWGVFYKVILSTGQTGYIQRKSKYIDVNQK